jgi:hypothetical protein
MFSIKIGNDEILVWLSLKKIGIFKQKNKKGWPK